MTNMHDRSYERVQPATISGLNSNETEYKPRRDGGLFLQAVLAIVKGCLNNGAGSRRVIKVHDKS